MKTLRKYIRSILIEKKFADLGAKKGEWLEVPNLCFGVWCQKFLDQLGILRTLKR